MRLQRALLSWFARDGRKSLPWRQTRDPYRILVSELMLQQTQVERVIPAYHRFIEQFPNFGMLAAASTADVVRAWKGLGYNLRAVRLKRIAHEVVRRYGGVLPNNKEALLALPGVGEYTAAALRVFAFEHDDVAIDANVRRVMQRIFRGSHSSTAAAERKLKARAMKMLPAGRAYAWNSALMDLGALVCTARAPACERCPVQADCAAAPFPSHRRRAKSLQERIPFALTTRHARGRIVDRLRALPSGQAISLLDLHADLEGMLSNASLDFVEPLLRELERDGIVQRHGDRVALSD